MGPGFVHHCCNGAGAEQPETEAYHFLEKCASGKNGWILGTIIRHGVVVTLLGTQMLDSFDPKLVTLKRICGFKSFLEVHETTQ
jgi:hypothetical protein